MLIGKSALDLYRDKTPDDIRREALFWIQADGSRGSQVFYSGVENGMHHWQTVDGHKMRLRSTPTPMSRDDEERMNASLRGYFAMERERMLKVGELR